MSYREALQGSCLVVAELALVMAGPKSAIALASIHFMEEEKVRG
jgi:hypothetical protein